MLHSGTKEEGHLGSQSFDDEIPRMRSTVQTLSLGFMCWRAWCWNGRDFGLSHTCRLLVMHELSNVLSDIDGCMHDHLLTVLGIVLNDGLY